MTEQKNPFGNEQDFDALLVRSVSDLPPDDITAQMVPGRKALRRIVAGYLLYTLTIDFLGLNLILPAIGQILVLLGFRALQHENRWFSACYLFEILHAIVLFGKLILNATIFEVPPASEKAVLALLIITMVFITISLCCFWCGLQAVQRKNGVRSKAIAVLALLVWNLLLGVLAYLQLQNQMSFGNGIFLLLLISYLLILWLIARLSKALDETGYMLKPAPVRISDRVFTLVLIAVLAIGCICGHLFFSSYTMDWHTANTSEISADTETNAHLSSLGFPEDILRDLTPEDLARLSGAEQVVVDAAWRCSEQPTSDNGDNDMRLTNIVVHLPGDVPRVAIIHHFQWLVSPDFHGTESLFLLPAYIESPCCHLEDALTGRILYDNEGQSLSADYHSIDTKTVTNDISSILQPFSAVYANFSFPDLGKNHRGYVIYTVSLYNDSQTDHSLMGYSQMAYIHQEHRFQYPVETAEAYDATHWSYGESAPFAEIHRNRLVFRLTADGVEVLE